MEPESECIIFEDEEDYLEHIKDQISESIKKYTRYSKAFVQTDLWRHSKDDMRRFVNYELEKSFSNVLDKD